MSQAKKAQQDGVATVVSMLDAAGAKGLSLEAIKRKLIADGAIPNTGPEDSTEKRKRQGMIFGRIMRSAGARKLIGEDGREIEGVRFSPQAIKAIQDERAAKVAQETKAALEASPPGQTLEFETPKNLRLTTYEGGKVNLTGGIKKVIVVLAAGTTAFACVAVAFWPVVAKYLGIG